MNPLVFAKSFLAGIIMCLAVGPISIIIIRRTVQYNKRSAFIVGVGSVVADIFYSAIAGFGLASFKDFFDQYTYYFQLVAAVILIVISFRILRNPLKPLPSQGQNHVISPIKGFFTGFLLALFNPTTLLWMFSLLSAFGVAENIYSIYTSISIMIGLFCGELLWWSTLTKIAQWTKNKIGARAPITIHKFTGIFLLIFGVVVILKSVFF